MKAFGHYLDRSVTDDLRLLNTDRAAPELIARQRAPAGESDISNQYSEIIAVQENPFSGRV
jgi:hypothetical protein